MSELTKQFAHLQSATHNEFASPDGSTQKYLADSIRNFGKAFGESTLLDRQYELAEKKAREDAEKKRKAEEEIRNNSNALRLFKAKGGTPLPEKETSWSPAAGNIENLEYANEGLRKEYNILFAESKIKEENSLTSASSKDLTDKWYQEYLNLDPNDPLKRDPNGFTSWAAHKASEYQQERFNDNLNRLSEVKEALKRTDYNLSAFDKDIAEQQQAHIDRQQEEFLDNYIDTDYNGGGVGGSPYNNISGGPPRTPDDLLKKVQVLRGKINKGNGIEGLYHRDKVHLAIIDNYSQRVALAKSSDDPIFDTLLMFENSKGMALTDLKGTVGEKWRAYHKDAYNRKVELQRDEEEAAEKELNRTKEEGEKTAFDNVTEISNAYAQAQADPGSVTKEMVTALEVTLHANRKVGYFNSSNLEDEYSEALKNITELRGFINSSSPTYKPVEKDTTDLRNFQIGLQDINKVTNLGEKLQEVQKNKDDNHWLRTEKIALIEEHRKGLEAYNKEDKLTSADIKASNDLLRSTIRPIEIEHKKCLGGDEKACVTFTTLSALNAPKTLTSKDHEDYGTQIDQFHDAQWDNGKNLEAKQVSENITSITTQLFNGELTLNKARTQFKNQKNKTDRQIDAWAVTERQYKEQTDKEDKAKKEEKSIDLAIKTSPEIEGIDNLEDLNTKENQIKTNKEIEPKQQRELLKEVKTKKKQIQDILGETLDESLTNSFDEQLNDKNKGDHTLQGYRDMLTEVDASKWYNKENKKRIKARLQGLIDSKLTSEQKEAKDEEWRTFDGGYKIAKAKTQVVLTDIVDQVAKGILSLEAAKTQINDAGTDFTTDNAVLLKTKPGRYSTDHEGLISTALKDASTASVNVFNRKRREKRVDEKAQEIEDRKNYKSVEKLGAVNAVTPAIKLKTVPELEAYKNTIQLDDADAQTVFVKEINKLIEKVLNGGKLGAEDLTRLSGIQRAEYDKNITNSTDITYLNSLRKTVTDDTVLKGKDPQAVLIQITDRIGEIKKDVIVKSDQAISTSINDDLIKAKVWDTTVLNSAIAKAKTIQDPETKESELRELRAVMFRLENRESTVINERNKLTKKQRLVNATSIIRTEILDIMNPAKMAEAEYTVKTSDATVKKSKTSLEALLKGYEKNPNFLSTVEGEDWKKPFVKAFGELRELQSSVSLKADAVENLRMHNESILSRDQDRQRIREALAEVESGYTEAGATAIIERIKGYGADLWDLDGNPKKEFLFTPALQDRLLDRVEVSKQLTSTAPKTTDQTVLDTFYKEYIDNLVKNPENPNKLITSGKEYIREQFIAKPPKISNSDYKYFQKKLNSYSPKAAKIQDGRMRALETIDSLFRTPGAATRFSPKELIAVVQGEWRAGNILRENLRSNFMGEWQTKAKTFENDSQRYEWATGYVNDLINSDDSPFAAEVKTWKAGIMGPIETTDPAATSGGDPKDPSINELLKQIITP